MVLSFHVLPGFQSMLQYICIPNAKYSKLPTSFDYLDSRTPVSTTHLADNAHADVALGHFEAL